MGLPVVATRGVGHSRAGATTAQRPAGRARRRRRRWPTPSRGCSTTGAGARASAARPRAARDRAASTTTATCALLLPAAGHRRHRPLRRAGADADAAARGTRRLRDERLSAPVGDLHRARDPPARARWACALRLYLGQARERAAWCTRWSAHPRAADLPARGQLAVGHVAGCAGCARNLPRLLARRTPRCCARRPLRLAAHAAPARWRMAWRYRSAARGRGAAQGVHQGVPAGRRDRRRGAAAPATSAHLHGHFCHGVATITWFASRLTGLPLQLHRARQGHLPGRAEPGRPARAQAAAPRASSPPAPAPTPSVLQRRAIRGPDDVHTIYHGLDTDWFSPARGRRADGDAAAADPGGRPLRREEGLRPPDRGLRAAARRGRARSAA